MERDQTWTPDPLTQPRALSPCKGLWLLGPPLSTPEGGHCEVMEEGDDLGRVCTAGQAEAAAFVPSPHPSPLIRRLSF